LSKRNAGHKKGREEEFQSFHKDGRIITGWRNLLRQTQRCWTRHWRSKPVRLSKIATPLAFGLCSLLNIIALRDEPSD
jgi:hypothetical protein